jgi:UDP-glucose 4-epimerase
MTCPAGSTLRPSGQAKPPPQRVLVTGGAGFIGSHTCLVLLEAGRELVVLDDFSNSCGESLRRVVELAGGDAAERLLVLEGDVREAKDLEQAFEAFGPGGSIEAVVHFAGLKAVGESVAEPLRYWDVNVGGTVRLLEAMAAHGCRTLVFSSSATVYGMPERVPIPETAPIQPINPYGQTKVAVEHLLADLRAADDGRGRSGWRLACLRYFNPVGAHPSGRIGEDPLGVPSNLFPLISQVALGRRDCLPVFGDDWPTADGTGERDFIHVMDLAEGHLAALDHLHQGEPQLLTLNLGSGQGHTVLQVVAAYEEASGQSVPLRVEARREGDAARSVADPGAAARSLAWCSRRSLVEMCRDSWHWQRRNPEGYRP